MATSNVAPSVSSILRERWRTALLDTDHFPEDRFPRALPGRRWLAITNAIEELAVLTAGGVDLRAEDEEELDALVTRLWDDIERAVLEWAETVEGRRQAADG
ncbi:MAG TPA: hypothetical protein VNJ28_03340 [Candidatus Limnocylindrales bacterium]|nr:hypothetical protein [Candidatus Limnocylindrales bacterium]